jgi:hypothetical protein
MSTTSSAGAPDGPIAARFVTASVFTFFKDGMHGLEALERNAEQST